MSSIDKKDDSDRTFRDGITAYYDTRSVTYDEEPNQLHPKLAADLIRFAIPHLPPAPHSLLDLACGTGLVSFEFSRQVDDPAYVHGLDVSKKSIEIANDKARKFKVNANKTTSATPEIVFEYGSANTDGIPSSVKPKSFSLITCCSAFVLLENSTNPDRVKLLNYWKQYLQPGGIITFDVPAQCQVIHRTVSTIAKKYGLKTIDMSWISKEALETMCVDAGLEVVQVKEVDKEYTNEKVYATKDDMTPLEDAFERFMKMPFFPNAKAMNLGRYEEMKKEFLNAMEQFRESDGRIVERYRFLIQIYRKPL